MIRSETQNGTTTSGNDSSSSLIRVSLATLAYSFITVIALSYGVGRAVRSAYLLDVSSPQKTLSLPTPTLPIGKSRPQAVYTGKYFDTPGVSSRATDIYLDDTVRPRTMKSDEFEILASGHAKQIRNDTFGSGDDDDGDDDEEEIHQPKGQHLLVDIKNVDGAFLNSEEQLANAMLNLISQSELTLLSYHCHGLEPMGVTCVGVLLESHVSFHTWPIPGVITLDLFTCGPNSLMPLVLVIENLFGIPQKAIGDSKPEEPRVIWSHKKRGFDLSDDSWNREDVEHERFLLGWREYAMKKQVAHEQTKFQEFEVYDVIDSRFNTIETHEQSLSNDGSYQAENPEQFQPDRVLYLSKIMQSRLHGLEAYHEALVHPAMMTHMRPRRVAIIGGGEGATLREVLKHNTVEKCVMVEIDGEMVEASKKHLPQWNDCSDLGFNGSCFDHPLAEVYFEDAVAWFVSRFSNDEQINEADKFDVIIMDALDPNSQVEFSDGLYGNAAFVNALHNSLTESGLLIFQGGIDHEADDPSYFYSAQHSSLLKMRALLQESGGFEKMKTYSEMHGGFRSPWSFHMVFRDSWDQVAWYANPAEVDLKLAERAVPTVSGKCPFKYFDGATMQEYQFPSKMVQDTFCRTEPAPEHCHQGQGFDPQAGNAPITSFEVKTSSIPNAGRGLHVKEPYDKGTYLAIETAVHGIMIPPLTFQEIEAMATLNIVASDLWKWFGPFVYGYGFATDFYGQRSYIVDTSVLSFINHGCNETNVVGKRYSVNEMTADLNRMPSDFENEEFESSFFDPFADRNHITFTNCGDKLIQDVHKGTELLDNYLTYLTEENWGERVADYRAQCIGQGLGLVTAYEKDEIVND